MLNALPPRLCQLDLSGNDFSGALDLRNLPASLSELYLHNNKFGGFLHFDRLPVGLNALTLGTNENLTGTIDAALLPASLPIGDIDYSETGIQLLLEG